MLLIRAQPQRSIVTKQQILIQIQIQMSSLSVSVTAPTTNGPCNVAVVIVSQDENVIPPSRFYYKWHNNYNTTYTGNGKRGMLPCESSDLETVSGTLLFLDF